MEPIRERIAFLSGSKVVVADTSGRILKVFDSPNVSSHQEIVYLGNELLAKLESPFDQGSGLAAVTVWDISTGVVMFTFQGDSEYDRTELWRVGDVKDPNYILTYGSDEQHATTLLLDSGFGTLQTIEGVILNEFADLGRIGESKGYKVATFWRAEEGVVIWKVEDGKMEKTGEVGIDNLTYLFPNGTVLVHDAGQFVQHDLNRQVIKEFQGPFQKKLLFPRLCGQQDEQVVFYAGSEDIVVWDPNSDQKTRGAPVYEVQGIVGYCCDEDGKLLVFKKDELLAKGIGKAISWDSDFKTPSFALPMALPRKRVLFIENRHGFSILDMSLNTVKFCSWEREGKKVEFPVARDKVIYIGVQKAQEKDFSANLVSFLTPSLHPDLGKIIAKFTEEVDPEKLMKEDRIRFRSIAELVYLVQ